MFFNLLEYVDTTMNSLTFMLVILTILGIALTCSPFIILVVVLIKKRNKRKKQRLELNAFFMESNSSFISTADKTIELCDSFGFGPDYRQLMFFNFAKKKILLLNYTEEKSYLLDFSDIIGYDKVFMSNSETNETITSNRNLLQLNSHTVKKYTLMNLVIKTKNIDCPIITYELFKPTLFTKYVADDQLLFRQITTGIDAATALLDIVIASKNDNKFIYCKYCGAKNKSLDTECKKCGSPL